MRTLHVASLSLLLLLAGCQPRFESQGSITIDGASFTPTACHVLPGTGGLELLAPIRNARLAVTIPPQQLDAWKELKGPASIAYSATGKTLEMASCAVLTMRGEGYHGSGKRAASGHVTLSCGQAQGELEFKGCF